MADRSLVISWGEVVRGREERAYENFNAVVTLYGRMQQEGRIERFDVTLLAPSAGPGGFMQLLGSAQQLAAVREDEEFRRLLVEASLIVDDLAVTDGYVNEGIAREMGLWQEAVAKVPQAA
jgi:hypothetical protein